LHLLNSGLAKILLAALFPGATFDVMMGHMSIRPPPKKPRQLTPAEAPDLSHGLTLDLERYVPAFITFIANKLSNSATAFYQENFGVNVTEWRMMSLLAIEPGIPASRICHVIGYDKGPVSRTLATLQKRGLVAIRTDPNDGRSHSISLTARGRAVHDKVIVVALERERRLLSCLDKGEREVLIDLLRRIHENLGAVARETETQATNRPSSPRK
jgi:DNA-binding MarR family transcriptional regulator